MIASVRIALSPAWGPRPPTRMGPVTPAGPDHRDAEGEEQRGEHGMYRAVAVTGLQQHAEGEPEAGDGGCDQQADPGTGGERAVPEQRRADQRPSAGYGDAVLPPAEQGEHRDGGGEHSRSTRLASRGPGPG